MVYVEHYVSVELVNSSAIKVDNVPKTGHAFIVTPTKLCCCQGTKASETKRKCSF